jgi:hypothetical protein
MDILITDVTEMHSGNYCVAGWNAAENRMIRPLPNGANWTAPLLAQHQVVPGTVIRVTGLTVPGSAFPHRTEDTAVSAIEFRSSGFANWVGLGAPTISNTINAGFGWGIAFNSEWNGARQGVYIPAGTQCASLVAVRVPQNAISFVEEFDKLKANINDGNAIYKLAVSSRVLKEAWRGGGIAALHAAVPSRNLLHVRVGLARPFGVPADKCYLMVNGVL